MQTAMMNRARTVSVQAKKSAKKAAPKVCKSSDGTGTGCTVSVRQDCVTSAYRCLLAPLPLSW